MGLRVYARFGLLVLGVVSAYFGLSASVGICSVPDEYSPNYHEGYDSGYSAGYDLGFRQGSTRGRTNGRAAGKTQGFDDGWSESYQPAYDEAFAVAVPFGKIEGYADAFPDAAAEGFQWASEVHKALTNYPVNSAVHKWATPLIDRWGDPSGWGPTNGSLSVNLYSGYHGIGSGFSGVTITNDALVAYDWAAHYYDEGYDEGHGIGKTTGDQLGYDQAYPIAFQAAYGPAFDRGLIEGELKGLLDGDEEGYAEGWDTGSNRGESEGFSIGADLYAAGGALSDLNVESFVSHFSGNVTLAASRAAAQRAAVPEPTSLVIVTAGLAMCCGIRRRR